MDSQLRFKRSSYFCYKKYLQLIVVVVKRVTALQLNSVDESSCKLNVFVLWESHKIIEPEASGFFKAQMDFKDDKCEEFVLNLCNYNNDL